MDGLIPRIIPGLALRMEEPHPKALGARWQDVCNKIALKSRKLMPKDQSLQELLPITNPPN